jgi:hypothetical protein
MQFEGRDEIWWREGSFAEVGLVASTLNASISQIQLVNFVFPIERLSTR